MDMGTLHLFPVPISDSFHKNTIPPGLIEAAQNIQDMANKTPVNKVNITRAIQSYLK